MENQFTLPKKKAVIFWPVATGDSATLVLKPGEIVMQFDLHHCEKAERPEDPAWPIIDHLVRVLPKLRDGRSYLAAFVLTHPDEDHVKGFAELLRRVHIGEIWHTPKIFRDLKDQESLCEDAKAFRKEAHRRRKAISASPQNIASGNRLRVIGHDDVLLEDDYKGLPDDCKSRPAEKVIQVDGNAVPGFQAFIHAPFSDDQAKDRNNTSLSLNVVLWEGNKYGQFFFFGDREYRTIKQIFEKTEEKNNTEHLCWDVMLSAHHCSKGVMYFKGEGDNDEKFQKDIMDFFKRYARTGSGYIVSSSLADFTDGTGDDPPHKVARREYEKIVSAGHFICTHEYPTKKAPVPLVFTIGPNGFEFDDERRKAPGPSPLAAVIATARPAPQPPKVQTGFGSLQ